MAGCEECGGGRVFLERIAELSRMWQAYIPLLYFLFLLSCLFVELSSYFPLVKI